MRSHDLWPWTHKDTRLCEYSGARFRSLGHRTYTGYIGSEAQSKQRVVPFIGFAEPTAGAGVTAGFENLVPLEVFFCLMIDQPVSRTSEPKH